TFLRVRGGRLSPPSSRQAAGRRPRRIHAASDRPGPRRRSTFHARLLATEHLGAKGDYVTVPYQERAVEHGARRNAELKRSLQISRARLTVFLITAGCVIWTFVRRGEAVWLTVDAVLVIVFCVLVAWHARVEERATWHAALQTVSRQSAARVERRWDDLPPAEPPSSIDVLHHPYAVDLDLFGRASLFQW